MNAYAAPIRVATESGSQVVAEHGQHDPVDEAEKADLPGLQFSKVQRMDDPDRHLQSALGLRSKVNHPALPGRDANRHGKPRVWQRSSRKGEVIPGVEFRSSAGRLEEDVDAVRTRVLEQENPFASLRMVLDRESAPVGMVCESKVWVFRLGWRKAGRNVAALGLFVGDSPRGIGQQEQESPHRNL